MNAQNINFMLNNNELQICNTYNYLGSWSQANQSLLFLLNATCLAEKQPLLILWSLAYFGSDPRSSAPEASTLNIIPPIRFRTFDTDMYLNTGTCFIYLFTIYVYP